LIFLACYLAFIVLFMAIPASLGFSFGIRNLYLATLYKVFEVGLGDLLENNLLMNFTFTVSTIYTVNVRQPDGVLTPCPTVRKFSFYIVSLICPLD